MFSSKGIKRLISKGISNIYYLEKSDVPKTCRKSKFLGKKIWGGALALKSKKVQDIIGETFILVLLSLAVIRLQSCVSYLLSFVLLRRLKAFIRVS